MRTMVRIRESLARSRCSQVVKKKPLPINHDFYEMLPSIHTVCRLPREELDFLILEVVRGASPTRRRVGSCGWSSFQPGSRGAAVARAARLALTPARQPAGLLYRGEAHPGPTRGC